MGNLARGVLFRMRAQDFTFCLLIVRYMLSDKTLCTFSIIAPASSLYFYTRFAILLGEFALHVNNK